MSCDLIVKIIFFLFKFLVGMKNSKNLILRPPEIYISMLTYCNKQYYKTRYYNKKILLLCRLSKIASQGQCLHFQEHGPDLM